MQLQAPGIENLNTKKVFTREEAQSVLPVLLKITERYLNEVRVLTSQMNAFAGIDNEKAFSIQNKIDSTMQKWQDNIRRLGAHPKGIWNVDFDCGTGFYCWKFPEAEIRFWHGYQDGFPGRVEIGD